MATRRMISRDIYFTDRFMTMPAGAQLLYTYFVLSADDEGFVDNAKSLLKLLPVSDDDLKCLIVNGFIILIYQGLFLITHWKLYNRVDTHHYTGTKYIIEFKDIYINENYVYSLTDGINAYSEALRLGYNVNHEKKTRKKNVIAPNSDELLIPSTVTSTADVGILSDDKQNSECSLSELNKKSNCSLNEFNQNSECTHNDAQLSKVESNSVEYIKSSRAELINEPIESLEDFIASHDELLEINKNFKNKLIDFFETQNIDIKYISKYGEYVYGYIIERYKKVECRMFYALCLMPDVLSRFNRTLNKKKDTPKKVIKKHWATKCPVCNSYHDINGQSNDCELDMSLNYSEEEIQNLIKEHEIKMKEEEEVIHNMLSNVASMIPPKKEI